MGVQKNGGYTCAAEGRALLSTPLRVFLAPSLNEEISHFGSYSNDFKLIAFISLLEGNICH